VSVKRLFNRREQFFDSSGNPASGAYLFFYAANSSTKQNTYNSSTGGVANSNPITLNSRGEPGVEVWGTVGQTYKIILAPSTDADPPVSPIWTEDNIAPINDTTSSVDEWVDSGLTPTFIGVSSFSFAGDQTTRYTIGDRLKFTVTAGTVYGRITSSAFTTLTTVTLQMDGSQALDSGLSAVAVSIQRATVLSKPERIATAAGTDTYTATVGISRLVIGDEYKVKISNANTSTTPTLNLDSIGAKTIVRLDGSAVRIGELKGEHLFRWDGTNMVLLNTPGLVIASINKAISGLTYSNSVSDATNDIDIAAGGAMDSTGVYWMTLASTLTKQLDAAWAVGSNAGGLDTGAIGNSDYYIWLIARPDTGVVDALYSLSSTAPTMPSNYTYKRLIGWFKRVGGTIVAFHTYETEGGGIELNWDGPTLDVNLANTLTTARRTDAVKVPLNFSVVAHLNVSIEDNTQAVIVAWVYCPDQNDAVPSVSAAPLGNVQHQVAAQGAVAALFIRTSSTGTVAARANFAVVDLYAVSTMGFRWARRN
jgi:hypothetical protein